MLLRNGNPPTQQPMACMIHIAWFVNSRIRYARGLQLPTQLPRLHGVDLLCNDRQRPAARIDLVHARSQPRVRHKLIQPQQSADNIPLPFSYSPNENLLAMDIGENIVNGPGKLALRHGRRVHALELKLHHMLRHQQQTVFEQAYAHLAPRTSFLALYECSQYRKRRKQPTHNVIGRRAHTQRPSGGPRHVSQRSEEHTSELQSLMRISYAVFCLKKKKKT